MAPTVIATPGVLAYEPYGFTNCVRCDDLLFSPVSRRLPRPAPSSARETSKHRR